MHAAAPRVEPSGTAAAVIDPVRVNKLGLVVIDGSTATEGNGLPTGLTLPFLNSGPGSAGAFWLYAGICAAGFVIIRPKRPETKNNGLEQIEHELTG